MNYLLGYLLSIVCAGALAWLIGSLIFGRLSQTIQHTVQVVLFLVVMGALRAFAFPLLTEKQNINDAEAGLLDIPAFVALKQREPQTFDHVMVKITEAMQDNQTPAYTIAVAQQQLQPIFMQHLLSASDDNLLAFTRLNQALFERLKQGGRFRECADYAMGKQQSLSATVDVLMPLEQEQRLALMEAVFLDNSQMTVAPKSLIEPIVTKALNKIVEQGHQDFSALLYDRENSQDYSLVCQFTIDINRELLALPKRQAAAVLRYLYANQE